MFSNGSEHTHAHPAAFFGNRAEGGLPRLGERADYTGEEGVCEGGGGVEVRTTKKLQNRGLVRGAQGGGG